MKNLPNLEGRGSSWDGISMVMRKYETLNNAGGSTFSKHRTVWTTRNLITLAGILGIRWCTPHLVWYGSSRVKNVIVLKSPEYQL